MIVGGEVGSPDVLSGFAESSEHPAIISSRVMRAMGKGLMVLRAKGGGYLTPKYREAVSISSSVPSTSKMEFSPE